MATPLWILDLRGRPVITLDRRVWADQQENDERWKVDFSEWTAEEGHVTVDTRFLGFDPRRKDERTGPPVLWDTQATLWPLETNGASPEPLEYLGYQRYQSRPAALRGHGWLVRELSGGGGLEPPGGDGKV